MSRKSTNHCFVEMSDEDPGLISYYGTQIIIALLDDQYPCVSIATIMGAKRSSQIFHLSCQERRHAFGCCLGLALFSNGLEVYDCILAALPVRCFTEVFIGFA